MSKTHQKTSTQNSSRKQAYLKAMYQNNPASEELLNVSVTVRSLEKNYSLSYKI